MNIAITALRKRIELLNKEYKKAEKKLEDIVRMADYYFFANDLVNISNECVELEHAIRILEQYNYITKK